MASFKKLVGIPRESEEEQKKQEVVKTPEFDLTQFAKGLVPGAALVLGGVIAALKAAHVEEVTHPAVLVGVLAVVAAAVLAMSFVAAVDIAARAFLSGEGSAKTKAAEEKEEAADPQVVAMPPGTIAWLQGDDRPYPVLAIREGDGDGSGSSYLVASGSTVEKGTSGQSQKAIDGTPKWEPAERVQALRPAEWP